MLKDILNLLEVREETLSQKISYMRHFELPSVTLQRRRTISEAFQAISCTVITWLVAVSFVLFCFYCPLRQVASWHDWIDYNTTTARLLKLGETPAVQVSGGQIPLSVNKEKDTAKAQSLQHIISHLPGVHRLPGCSQLLAKEIHRKMHGVSYTCPVKHLSRDT